MSARKSFILELVANGYELEDLKNVPTEDLALLVQDEYIENTWSPEARAAAAKARKSKGKNQGIKSSTAGIIKSALRTKRKLYGSKPHEMVKTIRKTQANLLKKTPKAERRLKWGGFQR